MSDSHLVLRGILKGHNGWVTSLATTPENPDLLVSASRDKTLLVWNLTHEDGNYGYPKKSLIGHSHFIQDVVISSDGLFALSASWDATLRLWDLHAGTTARSFVGHTKDVLSVAFSTDNRQIVSASRDGTIRLWNTLGECKFTMTEGNHTIWPSCVKFSPSNTNPIIVSGGWDKDVKVWSLRDCKLIQNLSGHTGYLNSVTVSPDGSLCASGGRDQTAFLWDLSQGKQLFTLDAGGIIHALTFSPNRYWLCAATSKGIKIWDLETRNLVTEIITANQAPQNPQFFTGKIGAKIEPISLAWSADGCTLFAGYTDNAIRVWAVRPKV